MLQYAKAYAKQMVSNARVFGAAQAAEGFDVVADHGDLSPPNLGQNREISSSSKSLKIDLRSQVFSQIEWSYITALMQVRIPTHGNALEVAINSRTLPRTSRRLHQFPEPFGILLEMALLI
jgi:hypothetical protein